jgi:purine nucleoside permease
MAKYAQVDAVERVGLVGSGEPEDTVAMDPRWHKPERRSRVGRGAELLLVALLGVCVGTALGLVLAYQENFSPVATTPQAELEVIKVVIVALFDAEAGLWLARGAAGQPLDQRLPFMQGYRCDPCRDAAGGAAAAVGDGPELYFNDAGVLLVITGMGTAWSAQTIMGLGMDDRFDLRQAFWLVAGIAGIDPEVGSVGSGVWADWVVDADLAHYIDSREMPEEWEHPFFPMRAPGATIAAPWGTAPFASPDGSDAGVDDSMAVQLDTGLVDWAYALTVDTPLGDSTALQTSRMPYTSYPQALRPPFVTRGDNAAGQTCVHN